MVTKMVRVPKSHILKVVRVPTSHVCKVVRRMECGVDVHGCGDRSVKPSV